MLTISIKKKNQTQEENNDNDKEKISYQKAQKTDQKIQYECHCAFEKGIPRHKPNCIYNLV